MKGVLDINKSIILKSAAMLLAAVLSIGTTSCAKRSVIDYEPLKYGKSRLEAKHVTVHDPNIVYDDTSGKYYIFGSHKAWAVSSDLAAWEYISLPSLQDNNSEVFKRNILWSSQGNFSYSVEGNMWAPAVIYNKDMGKWCMYMSINGGDYYSSIAMLTADKIDGDYEYAGTVIYSGFRNLDQLKAIDFEKVCGKAKQSDVDRYINAGGGWNNLYGTNAIDPCVFYDKDGGLWMSYGSWFGGIFLIKLDNETGLRDTSRKYKTKENVSDEYLGIRLSGGCGATGEGSFIVWDPDTEYYYLYESYCGLNATDGFSGYHIRLFRSKDVTGPYVDSMGNCAIVTHEGEDQSQKGIKLFGNYAFSSLEGNGENSGEGYMSGGHNSALIDSDGQRYLVYHTRFNVGKEWHEVRAHQQFMNEDGWPVTAVYEHQGSVISESGYPVEDIIGEYEFVDHGTDAATKWTGMLPVKNVTLNPDGTISGDVSGTWNQHTGADGKGYYAAMSIGGAEYKGVFFRQYDESAEHKEVMTFTLIGDNDRSVWGSKIG